jgi:hypothetical protein
MDGIGYDLTDNERKGIIHGVLYEADEVSKVSWADEIAEYQAQRAMTLPKW